jgi:hypothetical protein
MSKRLIISEDDRRSILNQYGLLNEAYDQATNTYLTEAGMIMYGDSYSSEAGKTTPKSYVITFPKGAKVTSNNQGVKSVLTLNGTMSKPRTGAVAVTYTCGQSTFVYFDKPTTKTVSLYSDGLAAFVNKMKGFFCVAKKDNTNQTTVIAKPADGPKDVKGFQQWVINTKKDKTILGKGGDSGFGDDGRWGKNTNAAWQKYGKEYTLSTATAFQAPTNVDGTDEKFAPPVDATATTSTTATTPTTATVTTPTTPTTPTTATPTTPEIAADLKTASEIRQQFRQGKRDQREIQRQYNKMYNTYNRLSAKMDKNTKDQYIAAMNALKQQLG